MLRNQLQLQPIQAHGELLASLDTARLENAKLTQENAQLLQSAAENASNTEQSVSKLNAERLLLEQQNHEIQLEIRKLKVELHLAAQAAHAQAETLSQATARYI